MKKTLLLLFVLISFNMINTMNAQTNLKAGFIYLNKLSPFNTWTYQHELSRIALLESGLVNDALYVEVMETADSVTIINSIDSLLKQGCNLIFTTSFNFMEQTYAMAQANPDKYFMNCSGYMTAPNMGTYMGRMYESEYLLGMMAAMVSKNGKIGYIAPVKIPEVYRGLNAFTIGAQKVKPSIQVITKFVGSWNNSDAERKTTLEVITNGADVIAHQMDSPVPCQVGVEMNIPVFGYNSDSKDFAPKNIVSSAIWNWDVFTIYIANQVLKGSPINQQLFWGFDKGGIDVTKVYNYSENIDWDFIGMQKSLIDEQPYKLFYGEIYDSNGNLVNHAGQSINDTQLLNMSYFVRGITELTD
jgi:basic membrane protein A